MSLKPEDVLPLIPAAFSTAREIVSALSPKAVAGVNIGERITSFIIDAEAKGLSPELIAEKLDELVLELKADIKFGV